MCVCVCCALGYHILPHMAKVLGAYPWVASRATCGNYPTSMLPVHLFRVKANKLHKGQLSTCTSITHSYLSANRLDSCSSISLQNHPAICSTKICNSPNISCVNIWGQIHLYLYLCLCLCSWNCHCVVDIVDFLGVPLRCWQTVWLFDCLAFDFALALAKIFGISTTQPDWQL